MIDFQYKKETPAKTNDSEIPKFNAKQIIFQIALHQKSHFGLTNLDTKNRKANYDFGQNNT